MNLNSLSHNGVTWGVERDVLTAIMLFFIRQWGQLLCVAICSMLVRCYWCISILIIIPVVIVIFRNMQTLLKSTATTKYVFTAVNNDYGNSQLTLKNRNKQNGLKSTNHN